MSEFPPKCCWEGRLCAVSSRAEDKYGFHERIDWLWPTKARTHAQHPPANHAFR